jgi:hypothetical protein
VPAFADPAQNGVSAQATEIDTERMALKALRGDFGPVESSHDRAAAAYKQQGPFGNQTRHRANLDGKRYLLPRARGTAGAWVAGC